jgi:hypothetical protein
VVGICRREPHLLKDVPHVLLDGALRDRERDRDRCIGASFRPYGPAICYSLEVALGLQGRCKRRASAAM